MKLKHKCCYKLQRVAAYPDVGEQLDAVFKLAVALQEQGMQLPEATEKWVGDLQAIKQTFPKE